MFSKIRVESCIVFNKIQVRLDWGTASAWNVSKLHIDQLKAHLGTQRNLDTDKILNMPTVGHSTEKLCRNCLGKQSVHPITPGITDPS